ncbi:Hypothetical predicted protein, partial [Marmota monax]
DDSIDPVYRKASPQYFPRVLLAFKGSVQDAQLGDCGKMRGDARRRPQAGFHTGRLPGSQFLASPRLLLSPSSSPNWPWTSGCASPGPWKLLLPSPERLHGLSPASSSEWKPLAQVKSQTGWLRVYPIQPGHSDVRGKHRNVGGGLGNPFPGIISTPHQIRPPDALVPTNLGSTDGHMP